MKLISYLFNRGLIEGNLKRYWWISALYALVLFFYLPMRYILQLQSMNHTRMIERSVNLLDVIGVSTESFQLNLALIFPVMLALLLFRYLYLPSAAAELHSLPFTRGKLYANHLLSAFILILLPLLFNGILLAFLQITTPFSDFYTLGEVVSWAGKTLLLILPMFSFAVFVIMFTGNTMAALAFNYILHMLPLFLYEFLKGNLRLLGYDTILMHKPTFIDQLPIHLDSWKGTLKGDLDLNELFIWYFLCSILFLVGAYVAYLFRHLEATDKVVSFSFIKPVFKYGVTFCTMLLGAPYFGVIFSQSIPMLFLGYLITSLLGYTVAEMFIQQRYRLWLAAYKGYLLYVIVMLALFGAFTVMSPVI